MEQAVKEGQGDNVIFKLTNCPVKERGDISKLWNKKVLSKPAEKESVSN